VQSMNDTAWRVLTVVLSLPALFIVVFFVTTSKIPDTLFGLLLFSILLNSFFSRRRRRPSSTSVVEMTWNGRWGWKVIASLMIAAAVAGLLAVPTPGAFLIYILVILTATWMLLRGGARRPTEVKKPESEPPATRAEITFFSPITLTFPEVGVGF